MNATRLTSSSREPSGIAKWLLAAFATGLLGFLGIPAFEALRAGEPDVLLSFALLMPWVVGPAAMAALRAVRARSRWEAWLFIGAEAAAIVSTAWLVLLVTFIKTGHENSETVITLVLLPVVEFGMLSTYALGVIIMADLFTVEIRKQEKPRITLLISLSIAGPAFLLMAAWVFGYVRA